MNYAMLMEMLKGTGLLFITETEGINNFTATSEDIDELIAGQSVVVRFSASNTGASTLNINNLGAKNITRNNVALIVGEIIAGTTHILMYDGTNFQIMSQGGTLTVSQLSSYITGYAVGANTPLAATDSVLAALGKIQGQINARLTTGIKSTQFGEVTGTTNTSGAFTQTVSIASVDSGKSILYFLDYSIPRGSFNVGGVDLWSLLHLSYVNLSNTSFSVEVRYSRLVSTSIVGFRWRLVEFY